MTVQMALALLVAIPVILFPVAFVWYLQIGGIREALKEAQERKAAREKAEARSR